MKPLREWPIVRTILGKNGAGKKLHQILPFPKVREALGSVLRGVADLSPIPNDKDASVREKAEKIYALAKSVKLDQLQDNAVNAIEDIHDLLDDGVINESSSLAPETKRTIRLATSYGVFGVGIYEAAAVIAGWPSVIKYVLLILGM